MDDKSDICTSLEPTLGYVSWLLTCICKLFLSAIGGTYRRSLNDDLYMYADRVNGILADFTLVSFP